jgi:hypothetical protein
MSSLSGVVPNSSSRVPLLYPSQSVPSVFPIKVYLSGVFFEQEVFKSGTTLKKQREVVKESRLIIFDFFIM